jgi:hypothetical protein
MGTDTEGIKIHGNDATVEVMKSGLMMRPILTALIRSAIKIVFKDGKPRNPSDFLYRHHKKKYRF